MMQKNTPQLTERKAQYVKYYQLQKDAKNYPKGQSEHTQLMDKAQKLKKILEKTRYGVCTLEEDVAIKMTAINEVNRTNGKIELSIHP